MRNWLSPPVVWLLLVLACTTVVWLGPTAFAAAQDPSVETGLEQGAEPSFLVHFLKSIGWVFGTIFFVLSISLVALIVMLSLDLRLGVAIPPGFVEQFTDTVNKRKFKEAFEMARADRSFLGRVMTNGMARLQYGIEDARDAAFNTVASLRSQKEQLINYIAVISSLGPYIGLVGTVFGMILSFKELARPGARVEAQRLADGISHALVVTMVGIGMAVPGLFFTVYFRNRVTRISMDTENLADDLLTQMYHNSKRPAGVPTGPLPTSPATPADSRSQPAAPAKTP